MPQVRNERDRLRRELDQALGLIDNIENYLIDVGASLTEAMPNEDDMPAKIAAGYPPNYRETMISRVALAVAICDTLELIKESVNSLKKGM